MKYFLLISIILISSCSSVLNKAEVENASRIPAEDTTCLEAAKSLFLSKNYETDLVKALANKKLLTFTEKRIIIQHPHLEWINKTRKSLLTSIRNWNNNRYPAFYLFSEEEIIPTAKKYGEVLEKVLTNQLPLDEESTKIQKIVTDWIKSYENYGQDLNKLLEERISLEFNVKLLKKLKLKSDESRDIQLSIMRDGVLQKEIITFRKDDKNIQATINKLKQEIAAFDGTRFKNGKIKDRLIRQAALLDMINIVHREVEYYAKNNAVAKDELLKELVKLEALLKVNENSPVTYGVYKLSNKIFIDEMIAASKLGKLYTEIKDPLTAIKTLAFNYFKNKAAGTDAEKIGFFQKLYAKVTSITPKQASIGGGTVVVAGLGLKRYFTLKNGTLTEVPNKNSSAEELGPEDAAHQEQLDQTKQVDMNQSQGHTQVIEVNIEELTE